MLITDDASPGTIIEGIAAEDDGRPDPPGALRYEIVGGDADGAFAIDSRTGVLSAAKYLDAEERTDYHLQVLVSDGELATLIVIDIEVERGRLRIPGS